MSLFCFSRWFLVDTDKLSSVYHVDKDMSWKLATLPSPMAGWNENLFLLFPLIFLTWIIKPTEETEQLFHRKFRFFLIFILVYICLKLQFQILLLTESGYNLILKALKPVMKQTLQLHLYSCQFYCCCWQRSWQEYQCHWADRLFPKSLILGSLSQNDHMLVHALSFEAGILKVFTFFFPTFFFFFFPP